MPQEIEARYLVPDQTLYERLLRIDTLGPYVFLPQGWQRIRDTYLDTLSKDLARQSWACRLREADLGQWVTLKGPAEAAGPGSSRAELEMRLPVRTTDQRRWPPGELTQQLDQLGLRVPLAPVAQVRQRRYHLSVMEGRRLVARLSLDRMRVRAQGVTQQRYLAECELIADGTSADLQALDALLVETYGIATEPMSKIQLAMLFIEETASQPQTTAVALRLCPGDSPSQAAAKTLARYTERMLANEPGVRQGLDPEAVHDMRVATRRMRSALQFYGPFLRDAGLDRLTPRLRRLGRLLGGVRDLDVALQRARAFAQGHALSDGLVPLLDEWERQRAQNLVRLVAYLDSPAYANWLQRWNRALAHLQTRRDKRSLRMGELAPLLVYMHWRIVWAFDTFLAGAPIETLHALRIEGKQLRYALECCADLLPPRILRWIPEVTALQDHLGDLNDYATAIAMLDRALTEPGLAGAQGAIETYRAFAGEQMAGLIDTLGDRWEQFARQETQRAFERLAQG